MTGVETKVSRLNVPRVEIQGFDKYYCMAQQIRPTLSKEEWALIEANRIEDQMYSAFKGNLPLLEAFEECLNPANAKGNRSFDTNKLEALMSAIMGCNIKIVNGRPYQDNKSPK